MVVETLAPGKLSLPLIVGFLYAQAVLSMLRSDPQAAVPESSQKERER